MARNDFQTRVHLAIWCVILQAACVHSQVISFGNSTYTVSESAGFVDIIIQRIGEGTAATVYVSTNSSELELSTNEIFFGENSVIHILRITIVDDNIKLPDIESTLTLTSNTAGEIGEPRSTTLRVIDDDVTTCPLLAKAFPAFHTMCNEAPGINTVGTYCHWHCPTGYRAVGHAISECLENGSWDNTDFRCESEVYCSTETQITDYGLISTPDNQQVGAIYESETVCPWYTKKENLPVARAECVNRNEEIYWDWNIDCGKNKTMSEILPTLAMQPISEETASTVLEIADMITEDASNLGVSEVGIISAVLEDVVALKLPDRLITDMVVDIISNLCNTDEEVLIESQREDGSPSAAGKAFEDQLQVVQIYRAVEGPLTYRRDSENVAVEVFGTSVEDMSKGIYAASDIKSTNTLLSVERSDSQTKDVEIEIAPQITAKFTPGTRVAFDVFADNCLFTSTRLQIQNVTRTGFVTQTNSRIISAAIGDRKVSALDMPVKMTYRPLKPGGNNTKCVYWDFIQKDWVTDGCRYVGDTPDSKVICECDHLTNFAILMDIYGGETLTKTQDYFLEILSYVGCSLSIIGLAVTLLTYSCNRKLKAKLPNQILMNLTSALLGLYIVFVVLLSIDTARNQAELNVIPCSVLAGILHYFTLASLFWMAVEGYNMYLMFIKVLNSYIPNFLLKASVFAWGGPLLVVAVTAAVTRGAYARSDFCFLAKWPLIGGVLVPIGVIVVFNFTIFIVVTHRLSIERPGSKIEKERKGRKFKRLRNAVTIMTLMGFTWGIGYLSVIRASTFFIQLVFCVLNTMQGYAIFMMHCVQQPAVRKYWLGLGGKASRPAPTQPRASSSSPARSVRPNNFSSNRQTGLTSVNDSGVFNHAYNVAAPNAALY